MKRQHVLNCMFSSWYPNFKSVSIKSIILKLPKQFLDYLNEDGVVLPTDEMQESLISADEVSEKWSDSGNSNDEITPPSFPDLCQKVNTAISELGGVIFPKLNWSSPQDASWITSDGTLRCNCFTDLCLLLKSSEFVTHDLTRAFDHCEDATCTLPDQHFVIVLRKWINIIPGMEFRCFVKDLKLIGISQRDASTFYEYLGPAKDDIHEDITKFFYEHIKEKFPDRDFVFDVYRYAKGKVKLIDFNPFSRCTDSLLYSWNELTSELGVFEQAASGENVDDNADEKGQISLDENQITEGTIRVIEQVEGIQPSPFLRYRMPRDILDVTSGEDVNKLVDFLNSHDLIAKEN